MNELVITMDQVPAFLRKLADEVEKGNAKMTKLDFLRNNGYRIPDNSREQIPTYKKRQFVIHMEQDA